MTDREPDPPVDGEPERGEDQPSEAAPERHPEAPAEPEAPAKPEAAAGEEAPVKPDAAAREETRAELESRLTRLKPRVLKWGAIAAGAVLGLVLLTGAVLYSRGRALLNRTYEVSGGLRNVPTDAGSIARGAHVLRIHGCQDCHGDRLEGKVFLDIPPGLIVAQNLTRGRGGVGSEYSAVDWDRAVRYGVRPNGRPILPFMPFKLYNRLNDADAAALASYLASIPAVDNQVPATRVRLIGYIAFGARGIDREGLDAPRTIIAPGPTPEYGAYLASTTCVECHGGRLEGGEHPAPDAPPGPGLAGYGAVDMSVLARALREGVAADGRQLSEWMPWKYFAAMTDVEIAALHAYLQQLAPGT